MLKEFVAGEGAGQFKIRATVRDTTNQKKMKPLQDFLGQEDYNKIEFVNADLMDNDSIDKAI